MALTPKFEQSMKNFIEEATGYPLEVIEDIITAHNDFIKTELIVGKPVRIEGAFSITDGRLRFTARLKRLQERYLRKSKEVIEKLAEQFSRYPRASIRKLDSQERARLIDTINDSFIRYLIRDFPYQRFWDHPYIKVKYSYQDILECLLYLRQANEQLYSVIYSLWIGARRRGSFLEREDMTSEQAEELLTEGIRCLLHVLVHKDLHPRHFPLVLEAHHDRIHVERGRQSKKLSARNSKLLRRDVRYLRYTPCILREVERRGREDRSPDDI